jgi:hypothetical protein
VAKRAAFSTDESHILRLLEARYGPAPPQTRLVSLIRRNPHLDTLDWSLLVMSIEIDLQVNMSRRLLDPSRWTVAQFARLVAQLPKVARVTHTIDLLTLLSEELLRTQMLSDPTPREPNRRPQGNPKANRSGAPTAGASESGKKRR